MTTEKLQAVIFWPNWFYKYIENHPPTAPWHQLVYLPAQLVAVAYVFALGMAGMFVFFYVLREVVFALAGR